MLYHRRKLLRAVVLAVESDGHELAEDLMTAFSHRLTDSERINNTSSQWSYKLYAYGNSNEEDITRDTIRKVEQSSIEEAIEKAEGREKSVMPVATTKGDDQYGLLALHVSNDMLAGETGCWDWEAGFFLSEFIFNHPRLFSGRRILELGSGCGMAGVALARVSAASVLCTDGDVEALDNCLQNLRINGLEVAGETPKEQTTVAADAEATLKDSPPIAVKRARWEDGASGLLLDTSIDIVVGADLTYDPVNIPPLLKILKEILLISFEKYNKDVVVYIATTRRSEATFQKFLDALEREPELQVEDISKEAAGEGGTGSVGFCHVGSLEAARERIVLHRITRRMS
jgi:predicted nicotinamide N-methyase